MRSRVRWGTTAVVLGLLVAGCGNDGIGGGNEDTPGDSAAKSVPGGYPVTVTDCMGARPPSPPPRRRSSPAMPQASNYS
jgi:iron complex transport system substrate-binding protein